MDMMRPVRLSYSTVPLTFVGSGAGRAGMKTATSFPLEDMGTWSTPAAARPQICDACYQALYPQPRERVNWKSYHALRTSPYRFTHIDYMGACTDRCWACNSRKNSGRHLVEVTRKPAAR